MYMPEPTYRLLDNKHLPIVRPTAYFRVACINHLVGFPEENGYGVVVGVIVEEPCFLAGLGRRIFLVVASFHCVNGAGGVRTV